MRHRGRLRVKFKVRDRVRVRVRVRERSRVLLSPHLSEICCLSNVNFKQNNDLLLALHLVGKICYLLRSQISSRQDTRVTKACECNAIS